MDDLALLLASIIETLKSVNATIRLLNIAVQDLNDRLLVLEEKNDVS